MDILHATTDPNLLDRLKQMLASSVRADIAVGYFFISGFEAVADDLAKQDKVRILVGRTDRKVLEEVAVGLQQADALRAQLESEGTVRRREQDQVAQQAVTSITEGVSVLPQTEGSESAVTKLRDLILSGKVEVKAYLRSPLHAKAYLCWYDNHAEPGAAVVGSSNFTLAGFTGNTELNVRVTGDAEMAELERWFEDLWQDSKDISQSLVTELDRSWVLAQTPPYHVYLKALYELYKDEIGVVGPLPSRTDQLANFQLDAVSRALGMIEAHGGCYIGDVVGLGKSFIGAETLRQLRVSYPNDGDPLIICPAGLKPMWERMNEMFGLGAAVVSQSVIATAPDTVFDEELGRYVDSEVIGQGVVLERVYPNRGPVLVDEAHNFRNLNQRQRGLASYLDSGDHKVVLMSATPQNLGPQDIYRQIRLFLDETEHGLNIEPIRLVDYFSAAEQWHKYKAEDENYKEEYRSWQNNGTKGAPPLPPNKPSVPKAEIVQVLSPVFIRRRRKDITELYGDSAEINGEPVTFPKPVLSNLNYRLDHVYAKAGKFEDLAEQLKQHRAARYRATDYIKDEVKDKPEYRDLFRAKSRIARLMGSLLFKRLESSIEAFRATLRTLIQSNRNFRASLEAGFVPIGNTSTRLLSGVSFDADELLEVLQREEESRTGSGTNKSKLVHSTNDFEVDRWLDDLDEDNKLLQDIANRVADIGPEDDDKLQVLLKFLRRPEVKSEKILIFSEAETTVEYIYQQLDPKGDDPSIARLSGNTRGNVENIIKRFSPNSNLRSNEPMPSPEIRVLIATDIVSEGQNLQDCARVLNYDLHWNPVRLVQRFGRIDRIGTQFDVINLHNMWPDFDVDAELSLTERLLKRIQDFHDFIGLDSKLLADSERLNTRAMYRIYEQKELPEIDDGLDEIAAHQRAIALLQRIQDEDPDLWDTITNLPDGIRSALEVTVERSEDDVEAQRFAQAALEIEGSQMPLMSPGTQAQVTSPFDDPKPGESLVLLSSGDIHGCYAVGDNLEARQISPAQLIAAAECDPETQASQLPHNTNERVMAAFEEFKESTRRRLGRARRPRTDTRVRRYLSKQLSIARQQADGSRDELHRIEVLRRIFLESLPSQVEASLQEIRNIHLEGTVLIRRLEALRERYRLNPPDEGERTEDPTPSVIRIVCSDGLV